MKDDALLVKSALSGDNDAFGKLVEKHEERLFHSLLGIVGSREDARDLVQDSFVQAYSKLSSFRGDSEFYTWLYRIAMNLALSYRRKRKPFASVEDIRNRLGSEPTDTAAAPESHLLSLERGSELHSALADLAPQHRQILVLREIESFSYESIAGVLDLPIGTVRSRLFRARLRLREKLNCLWGLQSRHVG